MSKFKQVALVAAMAAIAAFAVHAGAPTLAMVFPPYV